MSSVSHVWPRADGEDRGRRRIGDRDETPLKINGIDELKAHAGEDLGVTGWHDVTQAEVDAFADLTGDHQWIHVDPERARDAVSGGVMVTSELSFEREGGDKPVCVAETLMLAYAS